MFKRFLKKIDELCTIHILGKIICVLFILFLLMSTISIWGSWVLLLKAIIQPFLIGFILAYIMYPFVCFLERKGIPKNLTIIALWTIIIIVVVVLLIMLMPMLYAKTNEFITSLIEGINWISKQIIVVGKIQDFSLVNTLTENIVNWLKSYDDWLPGIVTTLPGLMSTLLDVVTNVLFSIIIAIYMLFDFPKIKSYIHRFVHIFFKHSKTYLTEMDKDVTVYLKSMIILMIVKLIEYCAFYFIIGHQDWLVIGILSSLGIFIPYLGGTIANGIGIITALTLPTPNLIALIVGILVLSNVDAYIISPLVHEKRSALGPLVTLFAVFAGGVLYGPIGIMASVPVTICVKSILDEYRKDPKHREEYENEMKEVDS